nr:hypothetical protein B0A51_07678 [Rachicladosporium sp. CCFEE 5018]
MEDQVIRLVQKAWDKFQTTPRSRRLLIAVSGIPGSGKTTLAIKVAKGLNELYADTNPGLGPHIAAFLPMDGYHLTRAQLSAMSDPGTAHARRGAAFTFDAPAFLALVKQLRKPLLPETKTIHAPSFDHAAKDPVADDITIAPSQRIVVLEGNYLSLGKGAPEWKEAAELMDELWFVDVAEDVAKKRLIERHVASGVAKDAEEAARGADENDLINGREIVNGRLDVHEVVYSQDDDNWRCSTQRL